MGKLSSFVYYPGTVLWYRSKGKVYGAIVLDYQELSNEYLVAISEEILVDCKRVTSDTVLTADLYTLAWFPAISMLPASRLHITDRTEVVGDFSNRAGRFYDGETLIIKNCGQAKTWKHEFYAARIPETKMNEVLVSTNLPKTYIS